jgi:hypothetical protein
MKETIRNVRLRRSSTRRAYRYVDMRAGLRQRRDDRSDQRDTVRGHAHGALVRGCQGGHEIRAHYLVIRSLATASRHRAPPKLKCGNLKHVPGSGARKRARSAWQRRPAARGRTLCSRRQCLSALSPAPVGQGRFHLGSISPPFGFAPPLPNSNPPSPKRLLATGVLPASGPPAGPPQRLHPHYGINTPPNASTGLLGNECCLACTAMRTAAWHSRPCAVVVVVGGRGGRRGEGSRRWRG